MVLLLVSKGLKYAGVQNGYGCHCGNGDYKIFGEAPMTDCTIKCPGNKSQICGGYSRNMIVLVR